MRAVGFILFYVLTISASHASIVQNQQYLLQDHPDSALTNTPGHGPYGLRLDSLLPDGAGPTFSVQENDARVTLEWVGNTVTIMGKVWNNSTNMLWDVIQTYTDVTATTDGFVAKDGVLTVIDPVSMTSILFDSIANGSGTEFKAADDSYRCGVHPDCGSLVARGWVTPQLFDPHGSNDWLVQLTPVPVPAALPLLISGLLGFSFFSRKKM